MHKHALLKDFTFDLWMGALVTKSTPEPIVAAIHRAMAEVVQLPNVKKGIVETGAQTVKPMNQPNSTSSTLMKTTATANWRGRSTCSGNDAVTHAAQSARAHLSRNQPPRRHS